MEMGYSCRESHRALRACQQSIAAAVEFINNQREMKERCASCVRPLWQALAQPKACLHVHVRHEVWCGGGGCLGGYAGGDVVPTIACACAATGLVPQIIGRWSSIDS